MPFLFLVEGDGPYHTCDACEARYSVDKDVCPGCGASYAKNEAYAKEMDKSEQECSNFDALWCCPGSCATCNNKA